MLNYKQSVYEIRLQYIENKIQCDNSMYSGERIEDKGTVKIRNCKSLLDLKQLQYKRTALLRLNELALNVKNSLEKFSIKFSVVLNLHYENVLFNDEKKDDRSYKYLRFVLKKENNMQILDFPINNMLDDGVKEIYNKVTGTDLRYITKMFKHEIFTELPHVFSSQSAGYFIHETIGHMLESDYYSFSQNKYNNILIPFKLRVMDSIEEYDDVIGKFKYDDNGTLTKPLTLISNGKISNIITVQRGTSFDKKLYGCARRESYKTSILPRMKNTYILPIDNLKESDIIKKYSKGIFVKEIYSGRVNYQTGNYLLQGNGFLIKNGTLQNFIGNMEIHGNILKDVGLIENIGADLKIYGSYCVKFNQSIRVGCGGPTISIRSLNSTGVVYGR